MSKRPMSSFFTKLPPSNSKKPRLSPPPQEKCKGPFETKSQSQETAPPPTIHPSYPHPISSLPRSLLTLLDTYTRPVPRSIKKRDLEIAFHQPFFPSPTAKSLYHFLRSSLPFYRVTYAVKRAGLETIVKTPRYTTVFGVDAHSYFSPATNDGANYGKVTLLDTKTGKSISPERYKTCICRPRPIPQCLEVLKNIVERESGETFNFVLVNYYADCSDSITYHSDDETFLGPNPTIASLSLGITRDFLMKHKEDKSLTLKLPLSNGELLIMKGATQRKWLHSIPKRSSTVTGSWANGGRINITFRKGMEIACTGNYYKYNVGSGPVYRWNEGKGEMVVYEGEKEDDKEVSLVASGIGIAGDEKQDEVVVSGD